MGCDGGTIPKRSEVVKSKTKGEIKDKQADLAAKWHFCHLSGFPLAKPIVACQLGHLYNKDRLIEYLLELKINGEDVKQELAHIKSLKDVKEIKLLEKTDSEPKTHQVSSGNEKFRAQYVCPISGLDMNGKYRFFYSLKCGCVISEKAIKEVPDDGICIVCSQIYDTNLDLIIINGDDKELEKLREKLATRKELSKLERQSSKKGKSHSKAANNNNDDKKNLLPHVPGHEMPISSSANFNDSSSFKKRRNQDDDLIEDMPKLKHSRHREKPRSSKVK